jgi:DNA-binding PadR family transcriptional regulator
MLDLAILGLLRDTPHHGYELKQRLAELGVWRVSFGSLYPALRRLERRGLIEAVRSTGRRKAYRLTAPGRVEFQRLLGEPDEATEDDRRFSLRLAFFRYLEPTLRLAVLQNRRRQLTAELGEAQRSLRAATARPGPLDRYVRALMERSVRSTQADIAWLDELIAAERGAVAPTPWQESPRQEETPGGTAWAR